MYHHTQTETQRHTHMECTVEYDGLHHRWVRRWAKSPVRDEQVLLNLSHGQTVPVVLMTCCLRTARFLSSSATRDSSNDVVGNTAIKESKKSCRLIQEFQGMLAVKCTGPSSLANLDLSTNFTVV